MSSHGTNNEIASASNSESSAKTTSSSSPPQRQAWTVRGQLLLNFHDAISRAINSPEMIQKCNDIAKDMARNDDENDTDTKTNTSIASQSYHHQQQQHNTKSIAKEYEAEAALIVENKTQRDNIVRNKSIAVGLFAFITLRSGRGISSLVRKAIANRSAIYKFDNIPSSASASSSMSHHAAQTTTSSVKQPSTIRKFINLSIDISISTTLTLLSGTYIFTPRPSSYIEDMSQLPLVQGKSVYAEMVCPPLLKEYRKVMEQFGGTWPVSMSSSSSTTSSNSDVKKKNENDIELTQEDVSLNVIRKFVENCSKRSKYERALLEERNAFNNEQEGSSAVSRMMRRITGRDNRATGEVAHNVQVEEERVDNKHKKIQRRKTRLGTVSIPSPGVPEDVAVDVDLDVFDLIEEDEEE